MAMYFRMWSPGPENSARFASPRVIPFSLDRSTSDRNCRSYFQQFAGEQSLRGKDSKILPTPLTTLARSTLCILFVRETDERNVSSFENWLGKPAMRVHGTSLPRTNC